LQNDLDPLKAQREKLPSWREVAGEREARRKRVKALTRASWKLLKPTLEFQRSVFSLLDVRATVAEDGTVTVNEIEFQEDLGERLHIVEATASGH
jgi:hypothetical protein